MSKDKQAGQQAMHDVWAWGSNVCTSVAIVFVNKVLMDPKKGYGFAFGEWPAVCVWPLTCVPQPGDGPGAHAAPACRAMLPRPAHPPALRHPPRPAATTLCAFHFLTCAGAIWAAQATGLASKQAIPFGGGAPDLDCPPLAAGGGGGGPPPRPGGRARG